LKLKEPHEACRQLVLCELMDLVDDHIFESLDEAAAERCFALSA